MMMTYSEHQDETWTCPLEKVAQKHQVFQGTKIYMSFCSYGIHIMFLLGLIEFFCVSVMYILPWTFSHSMLCSIKNRQVVVGPPTTRTTIRNPKLWTQRTTKHVVFEGIQFFSGKTPEQFQGDPQNFSGITSQSMVSMDHFFVALCYPPKPGGQKIFIENRENHNKDITKTAPSLMNFRSEILQQKCAESNIWFWCKHLILMCFEPKVWCHTPGIAVYFLRFSQTFGRNPTELASDFMEHVSPRSHPLFGAYFCKSISESC